MNHCYRSLYLIVNRIAYALFDVKSFLKDPFLTLYLEGPVAERSTTTMLRPMPLISPKSFNFIRSIIIYAFLGRICGIIVFWVVVITMLLDVLLTPRFCLFHRRHLSFLRSVKRDHSPGVGPSLRCERICLADEAVHREIFPHPQQSRPVAKVREACLLSVQNKKWRQRLAA